MTDSPAPRIVDGLFASHFDGKRFHNPGGPQPRGFRDVLRWKMTSRAERSPGFVDDVRPSVPPARVGAGKLLVTLVNHSTVLLQGGSANILTDPIWSERASPLSWAGPRRRRAPGVRQEDVPEIDIVLISHNHYDHLDLASVRWLARRGQPTFVVPRGVGAFFRARGIEPVRELDWGEETTVGDLVISCVPAVHFSARGLFDRNATLWCGYVVRGPEGCVYYAGDTAFADHFAQIRARFGVPRLALLPIGAYEPRWFMSAVHMSPEEALDAHRVLGPSTSVAIHHGTFQLADDGLDTPPARIRAASPPESFKILANGESLRA